MRPTLDIALENVVFLQTPLVIEGKRYSCGGVIPDLGNPTGGQPYKFGGKELITANGLNEYDFGARRYYQPVPHFTGIDRRCEKYYWLSPYLYCANNPVNLVDKDGNESYLWTSVLPGFAGKIFPYATHSFITVTLKDGTINYFAYGSKDDSLFNWMSGQLVRCSYKQDTDLISGKIKNEDVLKDKFLITPPEGMTQDEFDNKVISVAKSFGNQKQIRYYLDPKDPSEGNCNSSTYTILLKAGVPEETLKMLKSNIQGISWGFGELKPWTEEEQKEAINNKTEYDIESNRYESLQKSLP